MENHIGALLITHNWLLNKVNDEYHETLAILACKCEAMLNKEHALTAAVMSFALHNEVPFVIQGGQVEFNCSENEEVSCKKDEPYWKRVDHHRLVGYGLSVAVQHFANVS